MLLKVASLFVLLAHAQPPPRFDNHLGGVYDAHRGAYVPGSGTGAPRIGERVHPPAPPAALAPAAIPGNATVGHAVYSRGNESRRGIEEGDPSNFETQRIRLSLFTLPRPGGGVTVGLHYQSTLSNNDPTWDYVMSHATLDCSSGELAQRLDPRPVRLFTQYPGDRSLIGTTYTQQVILGSTPDDPDRRAWIGRCILSAGGRTIQKFRWTILRIDGRLVPTACFDEEAVTTDRHDALYRQVDASHLPLFNTTPFPTRNANR